MNRLQPLVLSVSLAVLCSFYVSAILIEKNAFKGISVSFSKSVHEENFKKLKEVLIRSSELLYHATKRRSYFGEFIISLPHILDENLCESTSESPSTVDIHLDEWTDIYSTLTTKHSGGCGKEGDIIYMPVHWLKGDKEDLAHQFVKQWSMYRYGVFEEEPVADGSCYRSDNNWSPVGCYNVKINVEAKFENGVPVCSIPTDFFNNKELKSSVMSQSNSSKILNFCDGSEAYPHNPALPTLHNNLCEGKTVWSVIEDSGDFKYGRNFALKNDSPPSEPVFKCFKEPPIQLTFAIQSNTKKDLTLDLIELGYFLYQFLGNMVPPQTRANIVMFSDIEDNSTSVDINLENLKELKTKIEETVKPYKPVEKSCLSCGFQKALDASQEHSHPSPIVILIAWESSLVDENPILMAESVRNFLPNVQLHVILVEDTATEAIPSALVDAVRTTGGNIHFLPKEYVFMASKLHVILAGVVRNHLQVEDSIVVVHESTYKNITKSFVDSFSTPTSVATVKLMYNIYCDFRNFKVGNPNCSNVNTVSSIFSCGEVLNINDPSASMRTWKYPFEHPGGPIKPNCSSVAMLLLSPSSKKPFILRGWMNKYQIDVGRDVLIIYAETAGSSDQSIVVFATVSSKALHSPITIKLLDNGNGDPDVKLGDGIYSRYFSSFTKKGIYVVSISAEVFNANDKAAGANEKKVPALVQKKIIGSFSVNEDMPDVDIFPPNRIADLRVLSIHHKNSTVTLQWTAPGENYDFGKATAYEVFFAEDWKDLEESMLSKILSKKLDSPQIHTPKPSGDTEQGTFKLPSDNSRIRVYYIAVRGIDKSQHRGKISNIIQVVIDTQGQLENTTNENVTGNETETSTDSIDEANLGKFDFSKCYAVLGGSAAVILLILIINVLIWGICCRRYKKLWKESQSIVNEESKDLELENKAVKDNAVHHSYTNPIMEEYNNAQRNGVQQRNVGSDPPVEYAVVVKRDKRDRDPYRTRQVGSQGETRQSERDLGLV